jgi:predicted O-methyltransferase YrrM
VGHLPICESDFSALNEIFYSAAASRLFMTAIGLKVFDYLQEPRTADQMAEAMQSDPMNTALMLDGLCALGLLGKKNGVYGNLKPASEFLVEGNPAYLGHWLTKTDESWQRCLGSMTELIKSGPGAVPMEAHMNSSELCEQFTNAHASTSLAGVGVQMAEQISGLPGFAQCRRMLDLGGGPGINAMAVAAANEQLKVTVFDRPEIVRLAQGYIRKFGFEQQVDVMGGDYLKDPLGSEYDLIMITDSLYYGQEEIMAVLRKCHQALKQGGLFAGIHAVLTHERTQPKNTVLGMLPEALADKAYLPEKGYLITAMERVGFQGVTSSMADIGGVPMEMNTGRKP